MSREPLDEARGAHRKEIAGRKAYRDLFDDAKRFGGALSKTVLDEPTRSRLKELEDDESIKPLPNAFDMAYAADTHWMPRVALVDRNPYALIYYMLFSASSFSTHPSVSAVARMTSGGGAGQVTVGAPEGLGESDAPYGPAYLALVNTLIVASEALGWPKPEPILALLLDDGDEGWADGPPMQRPAQQSCHGKLPKQPVSVVISRIELRPRVAQNGSSKM